MCGISGFEFLVIVVAAIIVLGPDKLPELLRMAGKATAELRRWKGDLGDMTRELQRSIPVDELRKNIAEDVGLERARARVKETEAEIDALRARLKQQVALEEGSAPERPAPAGDPPNAAPPQEPAPVDPLLAGDAGAPAADRPMIGPQPRPDIGPQPRPMNTAGRGVRRPERAAVDADPACDAPDAAGEQEPPLPELRPASGSLGHDAMPARPKPAAPAPTDDGGEA